MSDLSPVESHPPVNVGGPASFGGPQPEAEIYLDYSAATPCDPEIARLMAHVATVEFANPASSHRAGQRAARYIEEAREKIADAICALPEELVFTSGATESNNLAILGVAAAASENGSKRNRIVTLGIEHASVLGPCRHLSERGFSLSIAPVHRDGTVDPNALDELLRDDVLLLSIQTANNEIGTIQPVADAARIAHERGILVHTDATQALGNIPFNVETLGVDLASLSGHKCYGPKGAGALWISGGAKHAPIRPLSFGGGQEWGLRPGTQNTPAIAGFGEAIFCAHAMMPKFAFQRQEHRNLFETVMRQRFGGITINGALKSRLPNISSLTVQNVDIDAVTSRLTSLQISAASACHSGMPRPSHVLRAIGLDDATARSTMRIGFGRITTVDHLQHLLDMTTLTIHKLSTLMPEHLR